MIAFGLNSPPSPLTLAYNLNVFTGAAQALPALPSGQPWTYAMVTTNLGSAHSVAWGGSAIDATVTPFVTMSRATHPVVVNLSGASHVSAAGSGGGSMQFCPLAMSRGDQGMLRSPPSISSVVTQDTTAGGNRTLPATASGAKAKYVMFSQSSVTACSVTVGAAGTAGTMFYLQRDAGPIIINVAGRTHFSWTSLGTNTIVAAALEF